MSAREIRELLARHGLAAHRDRGQNFLHDARLAAKLARSAGVEPGDTVIEIGTGLGILTRALVDRGARVTTVEVDAGLVRALRAEFALPEEVELVHADAREVDLAARVAAAPGPVRVVANLPYAVATPLLRRLLDLASGLAGWSVLVQREVARRMGAGPGTRDYGSLAVLHALVTRVRRGLDLHPRCFYPVPSVVSTFVHVTPRTGAPAPAELARIERVVRAAFGQRRKTLANALRGGLGLEAEPVARALESEGLPPDVRAETLAPAVWRGLAARLAPPDGVDPPR
ncbi:MAG: 16S rRNA (adenine(1518)-N(6)/adenine(1519)-N(6))-dimethyltransferase RsmA [Myxococcota bacterium]|nr:16S rRNA (adenine(1518)-N(6)/adenine(1519)-N(6))-dimethyltransferase RsmA [Myxococcota bacterium]